MIPVKVTYTDFEPSEVITDLINKKMEKLEGYQERMTACEVFVSAPHRHQRKRLYHIRIHLLLPGLELEVNREPEKNYAHHDIKVAIRDAFNALYEQVEKQSEKRREQHKPGLKQPRGRVERIFPNEGYGFIKTPEGREIYFHEHSVLNGEFEKLEIGSVVRFAEEQGEKGPQVSSMSLAGH